MAKKFLELRAKMTPEALKRVESMAQTMLAEMPLSKCAGLVSKCWRFTVQVILDWLSKYSGLRRTVKISHFSDLGKAARV